MVLQIAAIVLLSRSSKTHEVFFSSVSNEITGRIDKRYSHLRSYFSLQETNRQLAAENARLRNLLITDFKAPDSNRLSFIDTLVRDSLGRFRKFTYLPAEVIGNTFTLQTNFITIERGSLQGVKKGMAVVSPQGIAGVVVETTENISRAMSLLHRNSKVSAMLKKDNTAGSIEWDGSDPAYLVLKNVSKSAKVAKGDTVLTSNYSANFPPSLMIGTVTEIAADPSSNYYTLKVKTATNFFNIRYVNLVENVRFAEQVALENTPAKTP
ncbi:rod shape-determining protein MreC [Sediminibacterium ginsengisoli]|uniref:Cell shape-determining protein MreC n=1 Tax=Sediminibacterium ginsengisoli TaxID=413434 RepID=A0A1T4NMY9_9BACT|nr:rod shape-determining protein MreC [Sediminibacterium ginsengisoli]